MFATEVIGAQVYEAWTADYLPFGGVHVATGPVPALRFAGQWYQAESGLHQNWHRDYDPTTGRYLQPDPLGLVDGASVYGYARQNPLRYTDPEGLQVAPSIGAAPSVTLPEIIEGCIGFFPRILSITLGIVLAPSETGCGTIDCPTRLYRAVGPEEAASIRGSFGTFTSHRGLEGKYFAFSYEGAVAEGRSLESQFDGPMTIFETSYPGAIGPQFSDTTPYGSVPSVQLPNSELPKLSPAVDLGVLP